MLNKDGKAIAAIISKNRANIVLHVPTVVDALADYMASANPRFNREQFVDACYSGIWAPSRRR